MREETFLIADFHEAGIYLPEEVHEEALETISRTFVRSGHVIHRDPIRVGSVYVTKCGHAFRYAGKGEWRKLDA